MNVREKISRYAQALESEREIRQKLDDNDAVKEEVDAAVESCQEKLSARGDAPRHQRNGILLLIVGLIFIVVEILCLTGIIPGMDNTLILDLIIIAIPFFFAIKQFKKAAEAKKLGSEEELMAEYRRLLKEQEDCNALDEKLTEEWSAVEAETEYTGKEWDLSAFYGTPEEIEEMEKDFVDLLIVLKHNKADEHYIMNCWLALNEIRSSSATMSKDNEKIKAFQRGSEAIRDSDSWILKLVNATNIALSFAILMAAMGTHGPGMPFQEAIENIKLRKPETDDERAILELAEEVVPDFVDAVEKVCRRTFNCG